MTRLLKPLNQNPSNNKVQLVCFPFAGGYSQSFRSLLPYLKDNCHIFVAEPPGHGSNLMPLEENFENLVDLYLYAMIPLLKQPFILFGHSMGGLVTYRLAQRLEQMNIFPEKLIISAVQPPHIPRKVVSHLNEDDFLDYVIDIGGIPTELVHAREMLKFFLPPLKADFKALETFEHSDHTHIQTPVHLFNGSKDKPCMKDATEWEKWVNIENYHLFDGGHMFLQTVPEKVAECISAICDQKKPVQGTYRY